MLTLFDIKCKNCGAPVGYDIRSQSYRCPNCGEVSGIQELHRPQGFRALDPQDRRILRSRRQVSSCPGCGAEILYEPSEESQVCSFCGSRLVRREFEQSDQFPDYIIPFVLTPEEAKQQLKDWAHTLPRSEAALLEAHLDSLEGCYLPYSLVRGPVRGYVLREHVNREFHVRGFVDQALVNTSRQLDNETLDAIEPFDLNALKPFEHGFIAGHRVKLADLPGGKRQRRCLQEASLHLRQQLTRQFHTEGIRVNLTDSQLLEIPVLLPVYFLKIGRRLAVVNGQTGRVAWKTGQVQQRSRLWLLEPAALALLVVLSLWLVTGGLLTAVVACPPLLIAIWGEYQGGRFSVFQSVIYRGRKSLARRRQKVLHVEADGSSDREPFPMTPVFEQEVQGQTVDVIYRFYPPVRVLITLCTALGLYFLPALAGALLHFVLGLGAHFRIIAGIPWYWCFGIFCVVYVFSGIRCDAYERPYIYRMEGGKKGALLGPPSSRRLSFLESVGFGPQSQSLMPLNKQRQFLAIQLLILVISILSTIL